MKLADNHKNIMSTQVTTQRTLRVPSDMAQIINQDSIEVYYKEDANGKPIVMGFAGKRTRPDFYVRFNSRERMTEYLNNWRSNLERHNQTVIERRQKRNQPHSLKVGDILDATWGYDQTNVTFYEVTKLIGSTMVTVRELNATLDWDGGPTAYSMPVPGSYNKEKEMRLKATSENAVKPDSFRYATPWNGKRVQITGPGWGH
jgi:hypothetical protein